MVTVSEVLPLLFERGNAMQSYWGYFITVSLGLLAFFGSAPRSKQLALVVSIAFIAFAGVNAKGMWNRANEQHELHKLLSSSGVQAVAGVWKDLIAVSEPPSPTGVVVFHAAVDLGFLGALWLLTLRPRDGN